MFIFVRCKYAQFWNHFNPLQPLRAREGGKKFSRKFCIKHEEYQELFFQLHLCFFKLCLRGVVSVVPLATMVSMVWCQPGHFGTAGNIGTSHFKFWLAENRTYFVKINDLFIALSVTSTLSLSVSLYLFQPLCLNLYPNSLLILSLNTSLSAFSSGNSVRLLLDLNLDPLSAW